ncbi:MAG: ferrous iron transport protein B [Candidatus Odinarchaeia archaeon]
MGSLTQAADDKNKESERIKILLVGNPNTGKSVIFNNLTGIGVTVSNYPGTTVELTQGSFNFEGEKIILIDLPGIYALSSSSMDQLVARKSILTETSAVIVNVVDASNLERHLNLTIQILELGLPLVIALNMVDEAKKRGINVNARKLSEILGVPVIPTVAIRGEGIIEVVKTAVDLWQNRNHVKIMEVRYGRDVEKIVSELEEIIENELPSPLPYNILPRALAVKLIEGDTELTEIVKKINPKVVETALKLAKKIEREHGELASIRIAKERYGIAAKIAEAVSERVEVRKLFRDRLSELTSNFSTGFPIMIGVFLGIFALMLYGGSFLEELIAEIWEPYITPLIVGFFNMIFPGDIVAQSVGEGLALGLEAGLAVVFPYVGVFYLILSILEDTGYLTRVAYLMDSFMHKIGLHGRAIVPIIVGLGCNVPAIMGTRILETKRERIIASFLILLVPCSARTVIILGLMGAFLGFIPALLIYGLIAVIILIVGYLLNKIIKGETLGLVMEMPPYRIPYPKHIIKKTWRRLKDFIYIAFPILIVSSIFLSLMEHLNLLIYLAEALKPLTQYILGLPPLTGITLFFGILRKELALEMLIVTFKTSDFLTVMSPIQIAVFTIVITLYFPCIASFAVLGREIGWKNAVLMAIGTIALAVAIGGITNLVLTNLNI